MSFAAVFAARLAARPELPAVRSPELASFAAARLGEHLEVLYGPLAASLRPVVVSSRQGEHLSERLFEVVSFSFEGVPGLSARVRVAHAAKLYGRVHPMALERISFYRSPRALLPLSPLRLARLLDSLPLPTTS